MIHFALRNMRTIVAVALCAFYLAASTQAYNSTCDRGWTCTKLTNCNLYLNHIKKLHVTDPVEHKRFMTEIMSNRICGYKQKAAHVCCPNADLFYHAIMSAAKCGSFNWNINKTIVDGHSPSADLKGFPWLALLEYKKPEGKKFGCGGVLISDRYVLTAAHCLDPVLGLIGKVHLHMHSLDKDCQQDKQNCQAVVADVEETIIHEDYDFLRGPPDFDEKLNDIGLLRLNESVSIQPICIADETVKEDKYITAGWSAMPFGKDSLLNNNLRMTRLRNATCDSRYPNYLKDDVICASPKSSDLVCIGDSGGALMTTDERARMMVIGISTTDDSVQCKDNVPEFYTDVRQYRDWIFSKMRD